MGYNDATITNSYWNTETTGQSGSAGGKGLTTAQMTHQASFTGFDFSSSWAISEGFTFPYLRETTHRIVIANLTGNEGWRMMAPPIENLSYASLLDPLWIQGIPGGDVTGGTPNLYKWNETTQTFEAVSNASNMPTAGTGFIFYIYNDQNYDGTPEGFPKTLLVEGEEDTSAVTPSLSYHDGGTVDNGFNLVGNPYGVTIDWDAVGWTKTNLNAAFYVWDNASGSYLSWNGATGTLPDGKIAPFQGFWVQANAASPVLEFTDAVQSTGGVFYGKAGSRNTEQPVPQIKFSLEECRSGCHPDNSNPETSTTEGAGRQPALQSQAIVMFDPQAKTGRDRLDAVKLASLNAEYLSLYTTGTDGNALDINALPSFAKASEGGPHANNSSPSTLDVDMDLDGSALGGEYTLAWSPESLPEGWSATLTDTYSDTELDLSRDGEYSFTVAKSNEKATNKSPLGRGGSDGVGSGVGSAGKLPALRGGALPTVLKGKVKNHRFVLRFIPNAAPPQKLPQQLSISPAYPNPFSSRCNIDLALPEKAHVRISIYDILGRKITTVTDKQMDAGYHTLSMDADAMGVASGVYICRLKAGRTTKTMKMTFIK